MMLLAAMTALFMGAGWLIGGGSGALIALAMAAAMNFYAFWNSDRLALSRHNAQPITRAAAPDLHDMVAALARRADLPMPALYILPTDQPNAFATGRNPENAAVAVTEGLLRSLDRRELAGVIAHELAHVKNRDTLTMTIAATVAGAVSMLAQIGQFGLFFGGGDNRNNPLGMVGLLLGIFLAPLAAMLIQMAISRTREYAADRMAAGITGDPMGLASALQGIAGGAARREMVSAERSPASTPMFIINPLHGRAFDGLFATHPATENRIAALRAMAGEAAPAQASGPWG